MNAPMATSSVPLAAAILATNPETKDRAPSHQEHADFWGVLPAWTALLGSLYNVVTGEVTLVTLGNYNLQVPELVLLTCPLAIFALATRHPPQLSLARAFALVFVALWACSMARGLGTDPGAALLSARANATLPAFLLLAIFPVNDGTLATLMRAIMLCAVAVSAIVFLRQVFGPTLFLQTTVREVLDVHDGGRAISSQAALILATATLIAASRLFAASRDHGKFTLHLLSALSFGTALMTSLQGTAILAWLAGLAAILAFAPGPTLVLRQILVVTVLACGLIALALAPESLSPDTYARLLPEDLQDQLSRRLANAQTRMLVATGFLQSFEAWPAIDQLFGPPAGQAYPIVIDHWGGIYWTASLHNGYLGVMQSLGYAGLLALLLLLGGIATAALSALLHRQDNWAALALALLAVLLTFALGYDLRNEAGVYMWLAVGLATRGGRVRDLYGASAATTPSTNRSAMDSME